MSTLTLELFLWMLLAFFVGCIIGCTLYGIFDGMRRRALAMAAEAAAGPHQWSHAPVDDAGTLAPPPAPSHPASQPRGGAQAAAAPAPEAASGKPRPPQGLSRRPDEGADDLKRISGVGANIERTLQDLGIYQYRQIAAWTADEVQWVDEHLNFRGRIEREEWLVQARLLASGDEETFARQFGSGGLADQSGKTQSGSHTRRS